jgi:hypothetical protein
MLFKVTWFSLFFCLAPLFLVFLPFFLFMNLPHLSRDTIAFPILDPTQSDLARCMGPTKVGQTIALPKNASLITLGPKQRAQKFAMGSFNCGLPRQETILPTLSAVTVAFQRV